MRSPQRNDRPANPRKLSRRSFMAVAGPAAAGLVAAGATLAHVGRTFPAENRKRIRLGVVGGGFGAGFWWHEHPNCVVTGVTDLYPARRTALKNRYKCDRVYDSLEIMLKEAKDIDAVAVFSGAPDHAKHVRWCMERGWHAVSAVPACITLEEAAMLKEVKEKTGLKYMMAESSYYNQECIYARNMFRAGGFGELFYSENEYYHQLFNLATVLTDKSLLCYDPGGNRSWRWGLPPMLYPTHSLGYLVGVTKERVTKVSCLGWRGNRPDIRENAIVADNVYKNPFWSEAAMMLTDQNHMCRCNVFWLCVAGGERAQWFGDKATLYMDKGGVHGSVEHTRQGAHPAKIPQYWKTDMLPEPMRHASGHGGSAVFISAEFINALVEDREPVIDLYESLAMTVPGIVAHQSAFKDGEQLAVPQFDRHQRESKASTPERPLARFTAKVKWIEVVGKRAGTAVPVGRQFDLKWVVGIEILSIEKAARLFDKKGGQMLLIHSPAIFFGQPTNDVVGRQYSFTLFGELKGGVPHYYSAEVMESGSP